MSQDRILSPKGFWLIAGVALAWNLIGVFMFLQQGLITTEILNELPVDERALFEDYPLWAMISFGIAVFLGFFGSVALVMRKKWARPLFIISLLGLLSQSYYNVAISKATEVHGMGWLILPMLVLVVAVLLLIYAIRGVSRGWLN